MSDLNSKLDMVKRIRNGKGIQSILDEAYKILENPIVMFNTEYSLIAYTRVITDDPIWNEIVTYGTFSKKTQELFYNEGFVEEVANSPKLTLMTSDKLKYDRIGGKIFNKNNTYVSNLVIVECNRPFEENDPMIFEAICRLISKEISKNELYQEYEQKHQETIIKSLIDKTYDKKLDITQVDILYDSLKAHLYTLVVDISLCDPKYENIVYYRDLLKAIEPKYKYAIYSNYIIIIISTNDNTFNVSKELYELIRAFEQNNMYAGISEKFENLFELKKYYTEALKAMQYTLESKSTQRIFPCNRSSIDKIEQIKKLKNGEGIQYFLDIGPAFFGNPLLFHDMELNLLGYSQNIEISDPIWEELITYGTSSDETINLFKTEGFINIMENTKGGALLVSKKIKYDRISWRIYSNDNIMIGCLSIVNTITPFTEDLLVLFGIFSQKFSKEVGKIEFYNHYGQLYSETVINRLISGKINTYAFYSEDIGNLYDNLLDNLYLVVADISKCNSDHANLTYFREMFNRTDTVNRYAIYDNHVIVIISTNSTSLDENNEFNEIRKIFEEKNIYTGVSSCFDDIYELPKYYLEAADSLKYTISFFDHD